MNSCPKAHKGNGFGAGHPMVLVIAGLFSFPVVC